METPQSTDMQDALKRVGSDICVSIHGGPDKAYTCIEISGRFILESMHVSRSIRGLLTLGTFICHP